MKDIKMSQWFILPITTEIIENNHEPDSIEIIGSDILTSHHAEKIEIAVNNHDRLVQERDELIAMLERVMSGYQVDASCAGQFDMHYKTQYECDYKDVDALINKIQGNKK